MAQNIASIHNKILKERWLRLEKDIMAHAPEVEMEVQMKGFLKSVNAMKFSERMNIVWRILRRKV